MLYIMKKDMGDTLTALAKVLPSMINTREAAKLARIHMGSSYERRQKLKTILGNAYYPLLGHFDGFYSLNLSLENDRLCLSRLLQRSLRKAAFREAAREGDISQYGDWSSFRNVVVDGVVYDGTENTRTITEASFSPVPHRGRVEFDFSGNERPLSYDVSVHDEKLVRMLLECGLLDHGNSKGHDESYAYKELDLMRRHALRGEEGFGYSYWQCDVARAEAVGEFLHSVFYAKLTERMSQVILANQTNSKPGVAHRGGGGAVAVGAGRGGAGGGEAGESRRNGVLVGTGMQLGTMIKGSSSAASSKPSVQAMLKTVTEIAGNDFDSIKEEEEVGEEGDVEVVSDIDDPSLLLQGPRAPGGGGGGGKVSVKPTRAGSVSPPPSKAPSSRKTLSMVYMPSFTKSMMQLVAKDVCHQQRPQMRFQSLRRFQSLDSVRNVLGPVAAVPVHDYFSNQMSTFWMLARHLALLVQLYDDGRARHTDYGSYRVELIVSLFSRIIDLHHFDLVLMRLTAAEHACVLARLGFLSIFTPWKPDGAHLLDFQYWEQRQVRPGTAGLPN